MENWKELFDGGDPTGLALKLGVNRAKRTVRALADDQLLLCGGASAAARLSKRPKAKDTTEPLSLMFTPEKDQSPDAFSAALKACRKEFPDAELAGFGPSDWEDVEGLFDRKLVLLGELDQEFKLSDKAQRLPTGSLSLALVYTPEVSAVAVEQAAAHIRNLNDVVSVIPLPAGAGDRIPLPGLTTSGSKDMLIITALRHLLDDSIRVRASWAALGWKVAQVALLYGADELAGWTAAETAVYTGRVRAAARVELEELECGLSEAGRVMELWGGEKAGV